MSAFDRLWCCFFLTLALGSYTLTAHIMDKEAARYGVQIAQVQP